MDNNYFSLYINELKECLEIKTDGELAEWFDMSRQQLSKARQVGKMNDVDCIKMAEMINRPVYEVIAAREAQKPAKAILREAWVELVEKTRGAASNLAAKPALHPANGLTNNRDYRK